jgi:hypothetical protein
MPKVKISEYSATANSNTDVASINIDEGCAPSGINNAIRAVMGHLKDFQQGTNGDPFNGPVNGTLGLLLQALQMSPHSLHHQLLRTMVAQPMVWPISMAQRC